MVNLPAPLTQRTDVGAWFRWRRQPRPSEVQELWYAFKLHLDALAMRVNRKPGENGGTVPIDPEIDRLLAEGRPEERGFDKLYAAKLRLALLMEDEDIRLDAARRFVEAGHLGVPTTAALQKEFDAEGADEKRRRIVYMALLDDLHLRYQRRSLDRRERRRKAGILNLIGFMLAAPAICAMAYVLGPVRSENLEGLRTFIESLHILAVVWFGLIGAYLSQMFALHSVLKTIDYDALATEFNLSAVAFRLMIGALGALLMYFLIVGQFLDGEMFPDWSEGKSWIVSRPSGETGLTVRGTNSPGAVPARSIGTLSKEFAQLLIWSTIAGFSERLIPDRFAAIARVTQEGAKR
jgi:hypothetical protein